MRMLTEPVKGVLALLRQRNWNCLYYCTGVP
jgi:hypothetical protein